MPTVAVGTGFQRAQPASLGQTGTEMEGGEGALIPGPGNRFLLGHFEFRMGFEKERRLSQGVQWATPDGVKSI